jgi:HNH endonuclease
MPRAACQECGAEFYARTKVVDSGRARYCSRDCRAVASRRRQDCTCLLCGEEFDRPRGTLRGEWEFHCCQPCLQWGVLAGEIKQCHFCSASVYRSACEIKKSRSQLFFCDHSCRAAWTNRLRAGENHPNWKKGEGAYRDILLRASTEPVCERCGNDDPRVLAVHHIDQDRTNNRLENLAWLCHNCHFLVHHFPEEMDAFIATLQTKFSAPPSCDPATLSQ